MGQAGPGNVLEWIISRKYSWPDCDAEELRTEKGIGVFGYKLKHEWFDIGSEPDLLAAAKYYLDRYILRMKSVNDLRLAEMVREMSDKYFLLCHRLEIGKDGTRLVKMVFQGSDEICKLEQNLPGPARTVSQIRTESSAAPYWDGIQKALRGEGSFSTGSTGDGVLDPAVLISGGIFLLDSAHADEEHNLTRLDMNRTLIPFLERDPTAKSDAGRLTTPAGRMDMLDIRNVCFSELSEEMVFYTRDSTGSTKIRCFVPWHVQDLKRTILQRLVENRVTIPGVDQERLIAESRLPERDVTIVTYGDAPRLVHLPDVWKVEIWLGKELCSECDSVIVIPDRENGTLEFRLAYHANITESHDEFPPIDRNARTVGNLLGIADGDGYQRRPFLISADEFRSYYTRIKQLARHGDRIFEYLTRSQHDSVELVAVGRPGDGRFAEFNCRMPLLPLTTSVRYLAERLESLWEGQGRVAAGRGGK